MSLPGWYPGDTQRHLKYEGIIMEKRFKVHVGVCKCCKTTIKKFMQIFDDLKIDTCQFPIWNCISFL